MAVERLPKTPLLLALLAVGANGLSSIAADTIFVSAFSLGDLSRFVGISALVRVASSFAYAAVADRVLGPAPAPKSAARLDAAVLVAAALALAASSAFAHSHDPAVLYAVCLAQLVLPPLLPLVAFNATTSTLRARHAKRVLPLVAGAATVGSIIVGGAAGVLAKTVGVAWILALGAVLSLLAAPLSLRLASESDPEPSTEREATSKAAPQGSRGALTTLRATVDDIARIPAVRVVVAFGFFGALATSFVDYAFKASLKSSYSREDVAVALGIFGVVSNTVVLGLQLFVTGPLVARLGVGRTLALGPTLLGAAGLAAFALPAVIGTGIARIAEIIVRYGVGNSVADVLIVPLERAARTRAKVLVKGAASPLGALAAGGLLATFGEAGPSRTVQLSLLALACVLLVFSVRRAPAAYAMALAGALARGRTPTDISPEAAVIFRSSVRQQLEDAVRAGRFEEVRRTLDLMTERFFDLGDTQPALLAPDSETRRFAIGVAARLAGPGRGDALLALVTPDGDARVENLVLSAARERGGLADEARIRRAVELGESLPDDDGAAALWGEALLHEALWGVKLRASGDRLAGQARLDRALKQLRKAAKDGTAARRAAALSAIGSLGDRRAEREVLMAAASIDVRVFREAARAAILLDASGAVAGLVARLVAGPHAGTAARALALAGPRAVRELIHALPTSRGEGAIAPTAVADGRTVSGTVRAARALARIGESASREVLPMFGDLGHRARTSVARAFSAKRLHVGASERTQVESAVEKLVGYGDVLIRSRGHARDGLLRHELSRRIEDTLAAIFDLAAVLGDRAAIQRARFAAIGNVGDRDNALELVETLLPAPLGANTSAFVARATEIASEETATTEAPVLDGWLEKCRKYDAREIPLSDPMLGVLDKVLVLRDVPLFRELSGEELYPVAEIAAITAFEAGTAIVTQGDPSDDLYVVLEGTLGVIKDGTRVSDLGAGKTFGELGVLDGEPRAATVAAETDCRLLRIPRAELEALLDESPEVARGIIRTLLSYVRKREPQR